MTCYTHHQRCKKNWGYDCLNKSEENFTQYGKILSKQGEVQTNLGADNHADKYPRSQGFFIKSIQDDKNPRDPTTGHQCKVRKLNISIIVDKMKGSRNR